MKNPIKPNLKTESFPILIVALSFLASFFFRVKELNYWPLIVLIIYLMFLLFPYFKINNIEGAALKDEWHKAKDISLSFIFIIQVVGLLILSGSKISVTWSLSTLLSLFLICLSFEAYKVIKYRRK